ncbi:ribosomal protein L27e, putative [Trichomonas vaginalis G3]|uniref:Ribosomal protein L27e, putative n=1 Tax=Trichomonas vaginalis (strain ATCC PRA-98 / G3) TaxID=412133 RepID=A2FUH4_TRIV3|nr:structural constituent of ribosome [Trichomonas vaginalis G3]EAX91439.1 ribosomal protein L27e, putative [Trichomonas vaginalis G3]KAI5503515.1 structural constituent of ribosome [Trichomonas vaginalis G3]|eukprot:XP_001304369.1 ribosomal protein L27e [Trichomonas vaginalis G3]
MSLLQAGRFVVMLQGRHAGKKAVVLAAYPEGTEDRKFPYAIVMGIEKYPKKVTKDMPTEVLVKKTQVKLFVKAVNFNHVMLTRHNVKDEDFFKKISVEKVVAALKDAPAKKALLTEYASVLRQKYLNNKMAWFFKPLQF